MKIKAPPPIAEPVEVERVDPAAEAHRRFWSQTDQLAHIRAFAEASRVSPNAVLAAVLRRAVACVEPSVVLPPIVGGTASVNFFTNTAGYSGEGKGASDAAGSRAVFFHDALANDLDAPRPSIGSGEGLARLFKGSKDVPPLTRAHLVVPEVKTLEGLMGRQGATLEGEILKAYMGESLGFHNSQAATTTAVKPHSYRLALGVGVQPENASFFLDREKNGFPQRFLWVPVVDRFAPEKCPEPVTPLHVLVPSFPANCDDGRTHILAVPSQARDEIDAHRYRVLTGDPTVNPLDGHLGLTRLKAGFGLAVLHGRDHISDLDWAIAGELIEMSCRVRDDLRAVVEDARRRRNRAKGADQAERQQMVADRLTDSAQKRVAKAIFSKLEADGCVSRRELRTACTGSIRGEFDAVFQMLIEQEILVEIPVDGKQFTSTYALNPKAPGGVPDSQMVQP